MTVGATLPGVLATGRPQRAVAAIAVILYSLLLVAHECVMLSESARYWANDFGQYWSGAQSLAAGHGPYAWLAENRPLTAQDYHYPPLLAMLLAPATTVL